MANVLIVAASKHGSTLEIAEDIADRLRRRDHHAEVAESHDINQLDRFDACVIGSAVYAGHWLPDALDFVERFASDLANRPVWLFSSGPVGDPLQPDDDPENIEALAETIGARGHRIFAGRLDKELLGIGERAMVKLLRVPTGDYRDWPAIRRWGTSIAKSLSSLEASV